ncbi:MAG TPA: Asp-tRNA(Asn)/Glu-tRNA(Gln) amidotransferase subunit GatC [Nitrososphaerales archaeon]|nr:Asp-tRNA(Asn)/Glu-tRNA(Gln) amidotransferase subunit GatC [Nitrososphaerales archaeon]
MPKARAKREGAVDASRVERLADLSRLSVSPQEAERLRGELSSILDYFAALDELDIQGPAPEAEAMAGSGQREDVPGPSTPDALLEGVPQKKGRYVRAPRVF